MYQSNVQENVDITAKLKVFGIEGKGGVKNEKRNNRKNESNSRKRTSVRRKKERRRLYV
jgi:hypothetical protein